MDNNLYQIELNNKNGQRIEGYIVKANNGYIGILYTADKGIYNYIYGKYMLSNTISLYMNNIDGGEYIFSKTMLDKDETPYEVFDPKEDTAYICRQVSLKHYDLNLGYEVARVFDITDYVNKTFENYKTTDDDFALSVDTFFNELDPQTSKVLDNLPF